MFKDVPYCGCFSLALFCNRRSNGLASFSVPPSGGNMASEKNKTKMTINMALVQPNQDMHIPVFLQA